MASSIAAAAVAPDPAFKDKVVLVTGAAGNFGSFGARHFLQLGCRVVLADANASALSVVFEVLRGADDHDAKKMYGVVCDNTKEDEVRQMIKQIIDKFGRIDMLWNNAGYQGEMKPILEYSIQDFQRVMDINVTGSFIVLQAVAKAMTTTGGGSIVNTASVAALRGTPTMGAYVASKAAIIGLTVTAAKDLACYDIRVNAVSPALIGPGSMWERQNELHAASGSPYFDSDAETVASKKIASVPMRRLGTVQEVVNSVAFLLGPASSYTTGTNMVIAGGLA